MIWLEIGALTDETAVRDNRATKIKNAPVSQRVSPAKLGHFSQISQ